jgi:nicotinamide riboside transporter PnuC
MNKLKWTAALVNITASLIQSTAIIAIQWIAWMFLIVSVFLWGHVALKEKDYARLTQQVVFVVIASIALYNWLKHV